MITAVDSNVLLDVFGASAPFGPASKTALSHCLSEGNLVACDVVWAETRAWFGTDVAARDAFATARVVFSPITAEAAMAGGGAWRSYRQAGGRRDRILADFLIGAHALMHADRLLTRDRGFYRKHFRRLQILDPSG